VSPVWLITLALIVTLGYTTRRTLAKADELRAAEELRYYIYIYIYIYINVALVVWP
jgi:hypothetical protein